MVPAPITATERIAHAAGCRGIQVRTWLRPRRRRNPLRGSDRRRHHGRRYHHEFPQRWHSVTLVEAQRDALDRGVDTIRKNYANTVKKGKLTPEQLEQRMGLLRPTLSYDDIRDADVVIEAVFEDYGVKESVFTKIDALARAGAFSRPTRRHWMSTGSPLFTQRPQDVVGLHFLQPRQRDEAVGSCPGSEDRQGCAGDSHGPGGEDRQDRRGSRGV